jgi:hypothetical protein
MIGLAGPIIFSREQSFFLTLKMRKEKVSWANGIMQSDHKEPDTTLAQSWSMRYVNTANDHSIKKKRLLICTLLLTKKGFPALEIPFCTYTGDALL